MNKNTALLLQSGGITLATSLCTSLFIGILLAGLFGCNAQPLATSKTKYQQSQVNPATVTSPRVRSQEKRKMLDPNQKISAQVLLRSATGATIDGNTIITSENISRYTPAPATAQAAAQFFKDSGFEVTPLVGISLTISGTAEHFSQFFDTSLTVDRSGGIKAVMNPQTTKEELPLNSLPKSTLDLITAVTFSSPPDFGPTNFGP
jgi:subtilase family serine protease